jgi:hypothetical protein
MQANYFSGMSRAVTRLSMLSWFAETTDLQISQKGFCSCSIGKRHQAASVMDTLHRTVVAAGARFSLEVVLRQITRVVVLKFITSRLLNRTKHTR